MADKETFKVTEKSAKYRTEIQQVRAVVPDRSFFLAAAFPHVLSPLKDAFKIWSFSWASNVSLKRNMIIFLEKLFCLFI